MRLSNTGSNKTVVKERIQVLILVLVNTVAPITHSWRILVAAVSRVPRQSLGLVNAIFRDTPYSSTNDLPIENHTVGCAAGAKKNKPMVPY